MKYLILLLIFPLNTLVAQSNVKGSYDLEGNLQYNFTNNYQNYVNNVTSYDKSHTIIFQPEFVYNLTNNIALFSDIEYSVIFSLWNSLQSGETKYERPQEIKSEKVINRIGLFIGTGYNIPFSKLTTLFVGTRIGLSSSRIHRADNGKTTVYSGGIKLIEQVNYSYDSGWRKREISFPSFILSLKFYPTSNFIVILKTQYTRTDFFDGYSGNIYEVLTFGFGLGVHII